MLSNRSYLSNFTTYNANNQNSGEGATPKNAMGNYNQTQVLNLKPELHKRSERMKRKMHKKFTETIQSIKISK